MPVSFRSKLFTSYILTTFSSETYSRKYEKLPNIAIHACKNTMYDRKNEFVENVRPSIFKLKANSLKYV